MWATCVVKMKGFHTFRYRISVHYNNISRISHRKTAKSRILFIFTIPKLTPRFLKSRIPVFTKPNPGSQKTYWGPSITQKKQYGDRTITSFCFLGSLATLVFSPNYMRDRTTNTRHSAFMDRQRNRLAWYNTFRKHICKSNGEMAINSGQLFCCVFAVVSYIIVFSFVIIIIARLYFPKISGYVPVKSKLPSTSQPPPPCLGHLNF